MKTSSTFVGFLSGIGSRFAHLVMVGALFGLAVAVQRAAAQWYPLPALDTTSVLALSVVALALTALVATYSHMSLEVPERHWLRQRAMGFLAVLGAFAALTLGAIVLVRNDWTTSRALFDVMVCSAASAGVLFAMFCSLANAWSLLMRLTAPAPKVDRWCTVRARSAV
jgi:hypothetical protein